MYINFMFSCNKAREAKWHLTTFLLIFLNALHLNLKEKVQYDMSNWLSLYLFCFSIRTFSKFLSDCFSCSCLAETPVVLVTSHLLKATDISIVSRLNNLRMVWEFLQNPGFQTEYLYQLKDWVLLLVMIFLLPHRHWRKCDQHNYCHHKWNM